LRNRRRRRVLVASASATFDRTGTIAVNVKLTRAGKRLLGHSTRVGVTAKVRFTPIGRAPVVVAKRFALG
jgi:hypothetical protein